MDRVEYQITFLTFFIGLGVADLFTSLVRMLKRRSVIRWHWLPLVWVVIAFMGLNVAWFAYQDMFSQDFTASGPGFLLAMSPAIFIFAFTVSILPHEIPEAGIDLKDYYFSNHRLIFSLGFLDFLSRFITQVLVLSSSQAEMPFWILLIVLQALITGLIISKNIYYHAIVTVLIFAFYFLVLLNSRLSTG